MLDILDILHILDILDSVSVYFHTHLTHISLSPLPLPHTLIHPLFSTVILPPQSQPPYIRYIVGI